MISDKTLEFIKNKLIEYNKAFGHLEGNDFLTFGYIWTSEDGMGMLHSSKNSKFKDLINGRSRTELDALRDGLLIVASNMYYDNKISNSEYNDICSALITIRDILNKAEVRKELDKKWAQPHSEN